MQEEYGVPLVVNGPVATTAWIEENPEAIEAVMNGLDEAVRWMADNPDAFREDGTYAEFADGDGWHSSQETTDGILALVEEGEWYLTSDEYTDEWRSAVYEIIEAGEGSLVDSVPAQDEVFADVS